MSNELDSRLIGVATEPAFSSAFLAMPESPKIQSLDIPQGQVIRNIPRGTIINATINPGACVLGIATQSPEVSDEFIAGHFFAGEIVRELQALARIGEGEVVVFQGKIEGEIVDLYLSGQRLTTKKIKAIYRNRDIHHLTNLT